ncbi:baseplate assembly protein [Enterobacter ludwigii]|uniref:baseplate assembly protein n=1 Tax=Enterobacter ludwigii TaxID=299767 RepID=UPI00186916B4|nr:baseplate J/gp47 family protein [Enterobacter ludwigii]
MSTVDIFQLPPPDVIDPLNYETLLTAIQDRIIELTAPENRAAVRAVLTLESEPLTMLTQAYAYRALLTRQRVNDAARAVMPAYASGTDLDNLVASFNVQRLVIRPADPTTIPPTPAVMETDSDLRKRAPQAFEGLSVAGPTAAYEFFSRSADGRVADAKAISPSPACVTVSILSREGDGSADGALIDIVSTALNDENTRPVADRLTVQSAEIINYNITAIAYCKPGPEIEPIRQAAMQSLQDYINTRHRIGLSVWRSAIASAISVEGVVHVEISEPPDDIIISKTQASYCAAPQLSVVTMNE